MANEVRIKTSAPGAKQTTGEIKGMRDALDRVQKQGAKGLGLGVGASVATAGLGMVTGALDAVSDGVGEAIEAASDLNESASKSKVIFGDAAGAMDRFADHAAQDLGMSKQAALEAGATFGNFFTGIGEGQGEAEKMSETIVRLSGDLASFNNLDPKDVLDKLRSGLTGEAEPLRSVGVFLTEAKVKAKAMELGLADAHGELSEGAKVLARYHIILDETKTAQGDFARTSDGLANQQRIVNAELENTRAALGEQLLPAQLSWEKGNLDIIRSYRTLNDVLKGGETPREQMVTDMQSLLRTIDPTRGALSGLANDISGQAEASIEAAEAAKQQAKELAHMRGEAKTASGPLSDLKAKTIDYSAASHRANGETGTLRNLLRDLGYAADKTDDAIGDLAGTIEDELFGDAINAGNEARLKDEIADLRDQRSETTKGSRKWKELTGEIAENEKALFDLHLEQAKEKGPQAVIDFLEQEKSQLRKSDAAARKYIDDLIALYQLMTRYKDLGVISFGRYTGKTIPGFASGVKNFSGGMAVVGEDGPEIVDLPKGSDVIPNAGSMPTTGGAVTVNVTVTAPRSGDPKVWGQVVGDAAALVLRQQSARLPAGARA